MEHEPAKAHGAHYRLICHEGQFLSQHWAGSSIGKVVSGPEGRWKNRKQCRHVARVNCLK